MIYGERIRLRGIERQDLPTFVQWINDPEVLEGIGIVQPYSQAEEDQWFEEMLKRPASEHVLGIEVRLPAQPAGLPNEKGTQPAADAGEGSWKLIGSCGYNSIDWRNRSAELGINIGEKSYWNQGYGTEAVRLLVQHGFHTLNLHRIFLRVLETNPRAIRAYEKAGFTLEGRQRQGEFRRGKYIDLLVMSILKDEF